MKKDKKMPSDAHIMGAADDLKQMAQDVVDGKIKVTSPNKKPTVADKLDLIKDALLVFKGRDIPYSSIASMIEERVGLKVSQQTLRVYCQEKLGFEKKKGVAKQSNSESKNKATENKDKNKDLLDKLSTDEEFK